MKTDRKREGHPEHQDWTNQKSFEEAYAMGYKIICGSFHVVGYSPDGDSIRFMADDDRNWRLLSGPPVRKNAKGHVQLRIEAIDTLETHFENHHQPLDLALAALSELLCELHISGVQWNDSHTKVEKAIDGTKGYIISKNVEKNGRPVSFVFYDDPPTNDGSDIYLKDTMLKNSVNFHMLEKGLAYPTYYTGLFDDLRKYFTNAVIKSRNDGLGIWSKDQTNRGFHISSLNTITEDVVILPKLFRRIISYMGTGGSISGFPDFMKNLNEQVLIISQTHFTHFDNIIEVNGNDIRLTELPENLIFKE